MMKEIGDRRLFRTRSDLREVAEASKELHRVSFI